ncbi:Pimeloyl-ACP methyl ester carboxylesterase [Solimonas aquatica]|uniref:Pimeloyl-ACP methyl ester carboxylesterase n=2 Tax=Solimonas aquatica TaxID=489703 RepID=A0A1H9CSQ3_9GAMM|nr:Pimeloyl-ACP methyl ester carboxylesterase [Solimonas aquatica]
MGRLYSQAIMNLRNQTFTPEASGRSVFVRLRGLRFHLRRWGEPQQPLLLLGHGLLDNSATFAPLIAPLLEHCQVLGIDWRGMGHSQWPEDGYWFADYVADLDALIEHLAPSAPLWLLGHSMGGQIMSLYAGVRPERVAKLILLDSLLLPDMPDSVAPQRLQHWLQQLRQPREAKRYASYGELAIRIRRQHPRLSEAQALWIARCWAQEDGRGGVRLLADPRHSLNMPGVYHAAESMAIWQRVSARTLFIDAGESRMSGLLSHEERARRRACFAQRESHVLDGVGHMIHFEAPETAAALILPFLRQ